MFGFAKKKEKSLVLHSPCNGKVIPITEVPDSTFAEKILGDGFAVIPKEGRIYAPVDGEITMLFDTLHALSLRSIEGTEILIHIGLDTVQLHGEAFTPYVKAGDKVKQGELLMEVDLEKIMAAGFSPITSVLICNTDDFQEIRLQKEGEVTRQDEVLKMIPHDYIPR